MRRKGFATGSTSAAAPPTSVSRDSNPQVQVSGMKPLSAAGQSVSFTTLSEDDISAIRVRLAHRYLRGQLLGAGSFGSVYEAYDCQDWKSVAVKVCSLHRKQSMESKAFLAADQAHTEAAVLAELPRSPHVIEFLASQVLPDQQIMLLVFSLVRGTTLHAAVERCKGPLPVSMIRHVTWRLLHALKHLHENGVVHGDVKPENILLNDAGEVRLADFGCASREKDWTPARARKLAELSPVFQSPECVEAGARGWADDSASGSLRSVGGSLRGSSLRGGESLRGGSRKSSLCGGVGGSSSRGAADANISSFSSSSFANANHNDAEVACNCKKDVGHEGFCDATQKRKAFSEGSDPQMSPHRNTSMSTEADWHALDVWSAGICVFYMATGRYPFDPNLPLLEALDRIQSLDYDASSITDTACRSLVLRMMSQQSERATIAQCLNSSFFAHYDESVLPEDHSDWPSISPSTSLNFVDGVDPALYESSSPGSLSSCGSSQLHSSKSPRDDSISLGDAVPLDSHSRNNAKCCVML